MSCPITVNILTTPAAVHTEGSGEKKNSFISYSNLIKFLTYLADFKAFNLYKKYISDPDFQACQ